MIFRPRYFLVALAVFLVEVAIARYVHDGFVRPYAGDFLVVILIYCFLRACIDRSPLPLAVATLIFACAVEIAQYFRIIDLLGLGQNRLARTVIGTTFSWHDLLAYALGVVTVYLLDRDR